MRLPAAARKLTGRVQRSQAARREQGYLRSLGAVGPGSHIYGRAVISAPGNVRLGANVHINTGAYIRAEGGLEIGDNTHISRNLLLYTMNHDYMGTALPYDEQMILKPVSIGRNVWIGMNVCIAPGTVIGDGVIVGMGTVVSGEIPPLSIIGSQPCRIIGQRDAEHYRTLDEQGRYGGANGRLLDRKASQQSNTNTT